MLLCFEVEQKDVITLVLITLGLKQMQTENILKAVDPEEQSLAQIFLEIHIWH